MWIYGIYKYISTELTESRYNVKDIRNKSQNINVTIMHFNLSNTNISTHNINISVKSSHKISLPSRGKVSHQSGITFQNVTSPLANDITSQDVTSPPVNDITFQDVPSSLSVSKPKNNSSCDETLYLFAFWATIVGWILTGIGLFCCVFVLCAFTGLCLNDKDE